MMEWIYMGRYGSQHWAANTELGIHSVGAHISTKDNEVMRFYLLAAIFKAMCLVLVHFCS